MRAGRLMAMELSHKKEVRKRLGFDGFEYVLMVLMVNKDRLKKNHGFVLIFWILVCFESWASCEESINAYMMTRRGVDNYHHPCQVPPNAEPQRFFPNLVGL